MSSLAPALKRVTRDENPILMGKQHCVNTSGNSWETKHSWDDIIKVDRMDTYDESWIEMCISIIPQIYRYGLKGITGTCNIPNIQTAM